MGIFSSYVVIVYHLKFFMCTFSDYNSGKQNFFPEKWENKNLEMCSSSWVYNCPIGASVKHMDLWRQTLGTRNTITCMIAYEKFQNISTKLERKIEAGQLIIRNIFRVENEDEDHSEKL